MLPRQLLLKVFALSAASFSLLRAASCREVSPSRTSRTSPEHKKILRKLCNDYQKYSHEVQACVDTLQTGELSLANLFPAQELRAKIAQKKFRDLKHDFDFSVLEYLTRYAQQFVPRDEQNLFIQSMFDEYKNEHFDRESCENRVEATATNLFSARGRKSFTAELVMKAMILRFTLLSYDYPDLVTELDLAVHRSIGNYTSSYIKPEKQTVRASRLYSMYQNFYDV